MTSAITLEQHERVRRAFEGVLDSAIDPCHPGQLELFTDEEERFIQHEVERLLWEPLLPNAGEMERRDLKQLREFGRDESLVVDLKMAALRYAESLEQCLPRQEWIRKPNGKTLSLPGCYYTRKPVTKQTNHGLWRAATDLRREASAAKHRGKKWLADYILKGCPQPVSNFKMECLYLMRGADGKVMRLVRLTNTKGEMSEGQQIGGADVLPNDMYAGSEKFRQWVGSMGNFTWGCEGGAGNVELQLLQKDVTEEAAYRVIRLLEYCGWHELKKNATSPSALRSDATRAETNQIEPGPEYMRGLWVFDEGAVAPDGAFILPDEDGIFWYEGEGYALSRRGRELDFIQHRPKLQPPTPDGGGLRIEQVRFDTEDWEPTARALYSDATSQVGGFFREVCRRFYDTAGGYEGWLSVAAVLGYLAAPELFAKQNNFPSVWISGQMGSGKSTFVSWLMSLPGFKVPSGMGLISKNVSAVGIACQLENYSNLPLWLDEFRQNQIPPEKEPLLRDSYNRQLAGKWTPDGIQRVIRTMPIVSGESTSSDAAMRSRYPQVLISEQRRLANHFEWMQAHHEFFFLIWRELLVRRREFVALTLKQVDFWLGHPDLARVQDRVRVSHSVCYAAFTAAAGMLGSHGGEELTEYRKFLVEHARATAVDVQTDVNVNVFIQDLIVAYSAGEIDDDCFRVEGERVAYPPGRPNQGPWDSYKLFIEPYGAISQLQIYLRKQGLSVALRYKDLRDQLSRNPFFISGAAGIGLKKRFGQAGSKASKTAWGILVDLHPLGLQEVSDEEFEGAKKPGEQLRLDEMGLVFRDGDPRRGPLFAIIEGVFEHEKKEKEDRR